MREIALTTAVGFVGGGRIKGAGKLVNGVKSFFSRGGGKAKNLLQRSVKKPAPKPKATPTTKPPVKKYVVTKKITPGKTLKGYKGTTKKAPVQKTSSGTDKGKGSSSSSSSAGKSPQKKVEKTKASAPEKKHNVIYKSVHRNFSESKNQALQNFLFKTRKQNSLRNMKCKNTNLARPKRDHSICTERSLPIKGRSNSFMDKVDDKGNLITRRFYDKDGRVKRDIDFTDHGYPKFHPQVPHKHEWDWSKNPRRGPWTQ